MLFCCDYLIVWALVITALSWWVSGSLCYPYKLFLDRVYLLGWLRQLGENPEPKKTNWINKHIWLPRMHLWCTVDSPRFFEAHQDDSDKVENDKSLQKYKDGIDHSEPRVPQATLITSEIDPSGPIGLNCFTFAWTIVEVLLLLSAQLEAENWTWSLELPGVTQ